MKIENDKIDEKSSLDRRQFIKKTLFSIPILTSISITSLLTSCEKDTEDLSSGGGGGHLGCNNSCSSSCSGDCSSGCGGDCSNICTATCGNNCTSGCIDACTATCGNTCSNTGLKSSIEQFGCGLPPG